jgi:TPR repeat protein
MQAEHTLSDLAFRAEGGDVSAQYRLGVLFLLGEVVEQDLHAAHRWLIRAADQQYPGALLLAEKLANWSQLKSKPAKRSIPPATLIRERMESGFTTALRFYHGFIKSIYASILRAIRGLIWKIETQNVAAKIRFRSEAAEIPARRREGFQFRDSL